MTDPAGGTLAARYGRRTSRRPRLLVIVVAAVLVAAGLAWVLWVAVVNSSPPVTSRLLSFEVVSPTVVKARIQVDRTSDTEASCRLQAKSADFAIVGETTLTVHADAPRKQVLEATITTQRSATAVFLVGCTTAGSPRPR